MKYVIGVVLGWFAHLHYASEIESFVTQIIGELR